MTALKKDLPVFPNYLQLRERSRTPTVVWQILRIVAVIGALGMALLLFVMPKTGLLIFWGLVVSLLPVIFLAAPGFWRNVCPMAALNQTPRVLGFSRAAQLPDWLQEYAYVIGFASFLLLASSRKWLFNTSGPATALLILGALGLAFLGGLFFKGKSGWCSTICPLLPVQRLYNQTPFALIGNSHCAPCVGCAKNCYDFNPKVATLADLYDDDPYYRNYRRFFAAVFPGFILAFYSLPSPPSITIPMLYLGFGLYMLVSLGAYTVLDTFVKVSNFKVTTLFAALALNLFFWFVIPLWVGNIFQMAAIAAPVAVVWLLRLALLAVTAVWIRRSYAKEPEFILQLRPAGQTRISSGATRTLRAAVSEGTVEVKVMPEEMRFLVEPDRTLLDVAEQNDVRIEAGCRMGVCGADPIVILAGGENLSDLKDDERSTLERLGLGSGARMACMARLRGPVSFTLDLSQAGPDTSAAKAFDFDPAVKSVVIIGNGIAGVTAADFVRRHHPHCAINLIGKESHNLYNRMAISRLIYGRSAMNGLYLQPDAWYEEKEITTWLNTSVVEVDGEKRAVLLGTGETLPFDRLILTTGSSAYTPPIQGYGLPGCFGLREAKDALDLRAFVQEHRARRAVVAGGGLLGLEAAYALKKLGLAVTVLERSDRLLRRQLDAKGSALLRQYLERLGIEILTQAECQAVSGGSRVEEIQLQSGRSLPADVLLVAAGIRSNTELAEELGLTVGRGIKVDPKMQTSLPDVYAAGDVCEYDGQVLGLWTVAVEQAKTAAINAVGGERRYEGIIPVTTLKVVGVELTSIGRFEAETDKEVEVVLEDESEHRYRKLVIAENRIVGAILLGYPALAPTVTGAIKTQTDVSDLIDSLRAGNWDVLES